MFLLLKSRGAFSRSGLFLILFTNKLDPEPPHPTIKPSIKCLIRSAHLLLGPSGAFEGWTPLQKAKEAQLKVLLAGDYGARGAPIEMCEQQSGELINRFPNIWERLHPGPWSRPTTTDFPLSREELNTWATLNSDELRKLRKV